jgi:hypothetical protein
MRARRPAIEASSWLAVLLLVLALGTAIDARLSAVWRVAIDSIDDPAAQERDEATPANVPLVHRGGEAAAGVAVALGPVGRLAPHSETAPTPGRRLVAVPRAPPAR